MASALLSSLDSAQSGSGASLTDGQQLYKNKVRPILIQNCYKCHTDDPLSHFRVDSRAAILQGGKRGPAIVPGDPEKSLLIEAVRQTGDLKMPKEAASSTSSRSRIWWSG